MHTHMMTDADQETAHQIKNEFLDLCLKRKVNALVALAAARCAAECFEEIINEQGGEVFTAAAPGSPSPAEPPDTCAWTLDDSNDGDFWETGCGEAFRFTDDGPVENGFIFCYKCGKRIDAATYSDFASAGEESK